MGTNNHLDLLDTLFMSPEGTGVHRIARLGIAITLGQQGSATLRLVHKVSRHDSQRMPISAWHRPRGEQRRRSLEAGEKNQTHPPPNPEGRI